MQLTVRKPAVAGRFYPADAPRLIDQVRRCFNEADLAPGDAVRAVVVPHAGYPYSGVTAAHAFKRASGTAPTRIILMGCSHHAPIETGAIWTAGAFETPLGDFPVDQPFAEALADRIGNTMPEAHVPEHSLEVQLPFIAECFGLVPIVPILFGPTPDAGHVRAGQTIADMMEPDDLLVCSTDLSHYLTESEANTIDRRSLEAVLTKDIVGYVQGIEAREYAMCGAPAVVAVMAAALAANADDWRLLDYRTSAAASGDTTRVVGYGAISMEHAS